MAGDEIVFVGVTSARSSARSTPADSLWIILKTRAPFWKREATPRRSALQIEARQRDQQSAETLVAEILIRFRVSFPQGSSRTEFPRSTVQ